MMVLYLFVKEVFMDGLDCGYIVGDFFYQVIWFFKIEN